MCDCILPATEDTKLLQFDLHNLSISSVNELAIQVWSQLNQTTAIDDLKNFLASCFYQYNFGIHDSMTGWVRNIQNQPRWRQQANGSAAETSINTEKHTYTTATGACLLLVVFITIHRVGFHAGSFAIQRNS